jgi:uncharacterized protein (TIGR02246 family)
MVMTANQQLAIAIVTVYRILSTMQRCMRPGCEERLMSRFKRWPTCLMLCLPLVALGAGEPDGQHDFDFSLGTWKTELSRLAEPLTGSDEWVEYEGTSIVRPVLGGRANLVELDVNGPAGRIEGMSLRLYNPESRQWSLNYAGVSSGTMSEPVFGGFKEGRGEFYGQTTRNGRAILVRFVITKEAPDAWRFEQSFSDDGARTWEKNWIAIDTLISGSAGAADAPGNTEMQEFWATLDATWKGQDADEFSRLFTPDARFNFVDRGQTLDSRTAIREFFSKQFPTIAPELHHLTTVNRVREIAPGACAVDGKVEILRTGADGRADPTILRTFEIYAVMLRTAEGWKIRDLRAYQLPAEVSDS